MFSGAVWPGGGAKWRSPPGPSNMYVLQELRALSVKAGWENLHTPKCLVLQSLQGPTMTDIYSYHEPTITNAYFLAKYVFPNWNPSILIPFSISINQWLYSGCGSKTLWSHPEPGPFDLLAILHLWCQSTPVCFRSFSKHCSNIIWQTKLEFLMISNV